MYLFNKSAYKKHKKGESFKEWLFYSRYPQMIPKILLMPYYVVLILHPIVILLCVLGNNGNGKHQRMYM